MASFGDHVAGKMKSLNTRGLPMAVGITWYTPETYARCLEIFEDAADQHDTFDAWLGTATKTEKDVRRQGLRVVRAEIDPDTFPAWCAANGFGKIDHEARTHFANLKAKEWMKEYERRQKKKRK